MKMLPLLLDRHILVVDPAPAVAVHVIVSRLNRLDHLGMTRQRHGDAKHGQRQSPLAELSMDAPETGAAAVLIQRIHRHMPVRVAGGADNIGQKLLRTGIAVQHVVFRALFVVQNKLHGDALLKGIQAMGLETFGDLRHKMNNVLGVVIPNGVNGDQVRKLMLEDFGIEIGTSFGPLHGKVWRIGTMGYNARKDCVMQTLSALEAVLNYLRFTTTQGAAMQAAWDHYRTEATL